MADPLILILATLAALALSSLTGHRHAGAILGAGGLVFLAVMSPGSVVILLAGLALCLVLFLTARNLPRQHRWRKYSPYLILPLLLSVDFNELVVGFPIATIGVSFSLIRMFMTIKESLGSRKGAQWSDLFQTFVATFYLPALPVGPVFSGLDLDRQRVTLAGPDLLRSFRLIFTGLMFVSLLGPYVGDLRAFMEHPLAPYVFVPIQLFISLFLAFWGQSLIAENFAPLFGHRIPVNFDQPWLARDIRDFWSRWHRSMANFVMSYIFLPLQVNGVSPRLATVIAFVFMGLWHNVSLGYLIWGLCHGLLLAFWPRFDWERLTPPGRLASRGVTICIVIALSWVANHGHPETWF